MIVNKTLLSICSTCKDGKETKLITKGGQRLLVNILEYFKKKNLNFLNLREVRCMSQCKRPCVISFSSKDCFTYVFGDIDPSNQKNLDELFYLLNIYSQVEEGFLRRRDRPELFKSNIIGRIPAISSSSPIITKL